MGPPGTVCHRRRGASFLRRLHVVDICAAKRVGASLGVAAIPSNAPSNRKAPVVIWPSTCVRRSFRQGDAKGQTGAGSWRSYVTSVLFDSTHARSSVVAKGTVLNVNDNPVKPPVKTPRAA